MKSKGRIFDLDELNAYKVAYGKEEVNRQDIYKQVVLPAAVVFLYVFVLYYYWWLAAIASIAGVIYGFRIAMPQNIKREYEKKALLERNRFVNNMTQILTNPDQTVLEALRLVTERAKGEFKKDLLNLLADLIDASDDKKIAAFSQMGEKYKKDVIFDLYLEQLTTAALEGRTSIESMKDIKTWHNKAMKKQKDFLKKKERHAYEFRQTAIYGLGIIAALSYALGWQKFIDVYAHSPIGWVFSAVYLIVIGLYFLSFKKRMADDEIMEVKI
ncbi:hypothetical protein [Bacillus sp. FSL H8-0515]|uniref:hypothetical protein n=1 Tax=Bacillus sp. FSL H8-0515 TaxID=2921396 RepID=UPI0030F694D6